MTRPAARLVLPLLCGSLLLAGCGDEAASELSDGPTPTATSPATSPAPPATTSPAPAFDGPEDVPTAHPLRAVTTLTGTVSDGVEAGCTVLVTADRTYLLIGAVPASTTGKRVTVTGRPEPTAVTTCMQGTPFLVQALTVE